MSRRWQVSSLLFVALLAWSAAAQAAPITFFGEDLHNDGGTRKTPHPNSDNARTMFLANLVGVGTESFESYADGTGTPLAIVFPGAGTATIVGSGEVERIPTGTNGVGRYPIDGDNFWNALAAGDDFTINFSSPIAAFGFYGVDVGDYGGILSLTLGLSGGGSVILPVGNTVGVEGSTDGSVLYFGFYDTAQTYTSIGFNNPSIEDFFAFDVMTIGSPQQVVPTDPTIPEPTSMVLLTTGLCGAGLRRWRQARRRNN